MPHGTHRKPRTTTPRLRRIAAGLSLAAAAATGAYLADDAIATTQGDTTWGAPDTTPTVNDGSSTTANTDPGTTVTPLDTTWG